MAVHLTDHRRGFGLGLTEVAGLEDGDGAGIGLAVLRMAPGKSLAIVAATETALLLVEGEVVARVGPDDRPSALLPRTVRWARSSVWDERPYCLHVAAGTEIELEAVGEVELTRFTAANTRRFAPRLYAPSDVREEQRGEGLVGGTCHRVVRTIFDRTNAPPEADLVLGEVITPPGKWSSYPPHHHAQPEIYHYRFSKPQGYGHAEHGDAVYRVRQFDSLKILPGHDHAQAAAPGYGMYYSWVVRHLPDHPYEAPTFTEEHRWVLSEEAKR